MKHNNLQTYKLKKFESIEPILIPNRALASYCGFKSQQNISIKAGSCTCDATVDLNATHSENIIKVSSAILNELSLPDCFSLRVKYDSSLNQLGFGPILGLYAIRTGTGLMPYGEINRLMQELQVAGHMRGAIVYVFSPQTVTENTNTLVGYCFDFDNKRWIRRRLPIPDVVYDRVLTRRLQRKPRVRRTRNFLVKSTKAHYFNRGYLDKWDVYKHLAENLHVRRHIPETRLCIDMSDVFYMLNRYRQVYVKPVNGSHGLGICWITRNRYGFYGHYINWEGEERSWYVNNARDLSAFVGKIIRRKRYIVQQGLRLASRYGKPADIRVLMQKNGEGIWKFTTFIGRVAAEGSKVSNFEHGGSLTSVYRLLKRNSGKHTTYKAQKSALINYSIDVCNQLENSMKLEFGELGLDLAVDVYGNLWLIEVNSRPARDISTEIQKIPQKARLSSRRIIDYAGWLSGFTVDQGVSR